MDDVTSPIDSDTFKVGDTIKIAFDPKKPNILNIPTAILKGLYRGEIALYTSLLVVDILLITIYVLIELYGDKDWNGLIYLGLFVGASCFLSLILCFCCYIKKHFKNAQEIHCYSNTKTTGEDNNNTTIEINESNEKDLKETLLSIAIGETEIA